MILFKRFFYTVLISGLINSQSYAANTPLMAFKDLSISPLTQDTFEIIYKNDKAKIQQIDAFRFKLNDQNVILDSSDTFEKIQKKMERAYKMSRQRSASLDELFISKAHAAPHVLLGLLLGGFLGFGVGRRACRRNADPATTPAPIEEPTAIIPEGPDNPPEFER